MIEPTDGSCRDSRRSSTTRAACSRRLDGTLAPIVADRTPAARSRRTSATAARSPRSSSTIITDAVVTARQLADCDALVACRARRSSAHHAPGLVDQYGLTRTARANGSTCSSAARRSYARSCPRCSRPHEPCSTRRRRGQGTVGRRARAAAARRRAAYDGWSRPLTELAERNGLAAEPAGSSSSCVRRAWTRARRCARWSTARRRGAVRCSTATTSASLDEVRRLRSRRGPGLLVCSGSDEVTVLAERADVGGRRAGRRRSRSSTAWSPARARQTWRLAASTHLSDSASGPSQIAGSDPAMRDGGDRVVTAHREGQRDTAR